MPVCVYGALLFHFALQGPTLASRARVVPAWRTRTAVGYVARRLLKLAHLSYPLHPRSPWSSAAALSPAAIYRLRLHRRAPASFTRTAAPLTLSVTVGHAKTSCTL